MSRPRFLADNDVKESIVDGVTRREPSIEFARARELGLRKSADPAVLAYAAENGWIVVSHDVNTMSAAALARMEAGQVLGGLILVSQSRPVGPTIDDLILVWTATEAEEWIGRVEFLPL